MSSILKALRKLEDEKADMGQGSVDIGRDILKRTYEENSSGSLWGIYAVVAAGLLLAAGWWLFSSAEMPQTSSKVVEQVVSAAAAEKSTVVDVAAPPAEPIVLLPVRNVEPLIPMPSMPTEKIRALPAPAVVTPSNPEPVAVRAPHASPLIIPDFVIEEIVFVAEPTARLAVINDLPVMQGTDIEGARVLEIYPDKVRFEYQGIQFDKVMTP